MGTVEYKRGEYVVTTDRARLNLDLIHQFLTHSYWAEGISRELVVRSFENSLCFGVFDRDGQVGFARVISDYSTFAYVGDVFILESHRGRGLGKLVMERVVSHPELQGLRRWVLLTRDAHSLYAKFGFKPVRSPEWFMEKHNPDAYKIAAK